jgi:glycogen(starch) synthase
VTSRRISVVVNTCDRAESLRVTLRALEQLDHEAFEVVVVNGPSTDHTADVLDEFEGRIKVGSCPDRNLSMSRNIGIALAAGDIVAFIDDDAYPDPAWLNRLEEGYDSDEVAATGGPVYDHTGAAFQARYTTVDRFGQAEFDLAVNPTPYLNSPGSLTFTHLIGTNASFRRDRLVAIGGFDEEFEYYLDETDVSARIADQGWLIRALDDGYVYHKFLPSHVRSSGRAARNRYAILKNACYFALKHGMSWGSFADVCERMSRFLDRQRGEYRWAVDRGLLTEDDWEQFEADIPRAFDAALAHHLRGPLMPDAEWLASPPGFRAFPALRPSGRRLHLAFLSQEWPPMQLNGIARFILTLSQGLAREGHIVHVVTRGEDHDRVDLEDGVWVHRTAVRRHRVPAGVRAPQHIWDYSASMRDELLRIHGQRPLDAVQAPNWDSEGIATLLEGTLRTVVWLHTPLRTARAIGGLTGPSDDLDAMENLEAESYRRAAGILACGRTIIEEIESRYGVTLDEARLGFAPHGISDIDGREPVERTDGVEVLFVGRLEARKGIDTLLACIPSLVAEFPDVRFTIVGNDNLPSPTGETFRHAFEQSINGRWFGDRVRFTGAVDDDTLLEHYASCDVFVAPSRFESFGLILIEAMRFAKPVVAARVGGMAEVVQDGVNGFLVPAGDVEALRLAIARLVASRDLRQQMGSRSRELYEERYTVERMVEKISDYYGRLASQRPDPLHAPAGFETTAASGIKTRSAGRAR